MSWIYKNINIIVDEAGNFIFRFNSKDHRANSLKKAKETIDELTEAYYHVDINFYNNMQDKLSIREKHFLKQLIKELNCHHNNPYCELDIYNSLEFIIDDKVFETCYGTD